MKAILLKVMKKKVLKDIKHFKQLSKKELELERMIQKVQKDLNVKRNAPNTPNLSLIHI